MITIEGPNPDKQLARVEASVPAKPARTLSVGELELALLKRYPRADAEPWDRTGLLIGDPAETVSGVAVALDVTLDAIRAASEARANVLLTHHPAFLEPPTSFTPRPEASGAPGVNVLAAAQAHVALMNFHTALDAAPETARLLPQLLNLEFTGLACPLAHDPSKGYGSLCAVRESDAPLSLEQLAARCLSVFGRAPRVWGSPASKVSKVAVANGSAGDVVDACLAAGADCLVCGELRYHRTLDAAQAGLAIIELGHDVSELPLCALLARAAADAGVGEESVFVLDQGSNWFVPDATRL